MSHPVAVRLTWMRLRVTHFIGAAAPGSFISTARFLCQLVVARGGRCPAPRLLEAEVALVELLDGHRPLPDARRDGPAGGIWLRCDEDGVPRAQVGGGGR